MLGSSFVADRRVAGAANPCSGSVFNERDPMCLMATSLRESIGRRILVESSPAVDDAFFDAAEVLVESLRGSDTRVLQKFDALLHGLLNRFVERPDIHDVRFAVPNSQSDIASQPVNSSVFPVAIVSELLTVWKLRIDMTKVSNWRAFAQRHGSVLLS